MIDVGERAAWFRRALGAQAGMLWHIHIGAFLGSSRGWALCLCVKQQELPLLSLAEVTLCSPAYRPCACFVPACPSVNAGAWQRVKVTMAACVLLDLGALFMENMAKIKEQALIRIRVNAVTLQSPKLGLRMFFYKYLWMNKNQRSVFMIDVALVTHGCLENTAAAFLMIFF